MKARRIIIRFCLCLLFCNIHLHAQEKPITKMHRVQAGTKDASGWYFARSTGGRFSVLLPVPFNDFSLITKDKTGKEIKTHSVGGQSEDGFKFTVMEAPVLKPITDLKSILKDFNPMDVKEERTATYTSVSCKMQEGNSYMRAKYLVRNNTMYMLLSECPVKEKANLDKIYLTFFNSLKFYP